MYSAILLCTQTFCTSQHSPTFNKIEGDMFKNVAAVFEYLLPTVSKDAFRYTDSCLDSLMHRVYKSVTTDAALSKRMKAKTAVPYRLAKISGSCEPVWPSGKALGW